MKIRIKNNGLKVRRKLNFGIWVRNAWFYGLNLTLIKPSLTTIVIRVIGLEVAVNKSG